MRTAWRKVREWGPRSALGGVLASRLHRSEVLLGRRAAPWRVIAATGVGRGRPTVLPTASPGETPGWEVIEVREPSDLPVPRPEAWASRPDGTVEPLRLEPRTMQTLGLRFLRIEEGVVRPGRSLIVTRTHALVPERLDALVTASGGVVPGAEMFTSPWTQLGTTVRSPRPDWRDRTATLWRWGDETTVMDRAIALFDAGDSHFGHSMIDVIPRLEALEDVEPDVPILVSARMPARARWWVGQVAPGRRVIDVEPGCAVRVRDLLVPLERARLWQGDVLHDIGTYVAARTDPAGMRFLQRSVRNVAGERSRRVWVRRDRSPNNTMTGERELVEAVAELGFEALYLESLSIADLRTLMSQTEAMIAPRSAALANLAHAAPGVRVLQLDSTVSPRDVYGSLVWLAELGHESAMLAGLPARDGTFHVDDGALMHVISAWLLREQER